MIDKVSELKKVITELKDIEAKISSAEFNSEGYADKITELSKLLESFKIKGFENFDKYSAQITDKIKKGKNTNADIINWYESAKRISALASFQHDGQENNITDTELDDMILDFLNDAGNINEIAAHYFAALRLAGEKAEKSYNAIMEDFRKVPDLAQKVFPKATYIYNEKSVKDQIYKICPICGNEESEPFYCANQAGINDNRFSPAKLWMKCSGCHNLYAYNFPMTETGEINGHYTKANTGMELTPRHMLALYSNIFNEIKYFNQGRKYLEIGIGNGEMLACALEMGYDVSAVEICRGDCENISAALGVDVKWCDFMNYDTDERFDVVIMGDVLEHVGEPIKALEKAHSLLNENGILWLSTPNFDSAFTRMRKFSDPMWNQKNHFTYFSFDTLKPFLDKIGLDVKRYDISMRYNGSMELILQKK